MASVSGSTLSFFSPNNNFNEPVNLILSDGTTTTGSTVAGAYNIEIFTSSPGTPLPGVDATALIEGAVLISSNQVQAGALDSTEELLTGNVWMVDNTGGELITAASQDNVSQSVSGSSGDTITAGSGSNSSLLVDASNARGDVVVGPETIIGGGASETVWAAKGDSIVGGSGSMTVVGDATYSPPGGTGAMTIIGGSGDLTAFDIGVGNFVVGSNAGATFVDASYDNNAQNTIIAGSGTAPVTLAGITASNFIKAGTGDSIVGNGGGSTMLVDAHVGIGDTITAGSASGVTVWGGNAGLVLGGTANMQFNDNVGGSSNTVLGGSGGLYAFNLGTGDSIVGGSGGTVAGTSFSNIIDDSYANAQGSNTLVGGTGDTLIIAGPNDSVVAIKASLIVDVRANLGNTNTETIDLSASKGSPGATTIVDDTSQGGTGTNVTVTGFQPAQDTIQSATSVDSGGNFIGTSTSQNGGTLLTFNDGTTMFLSGINNLNNVKFTQ